MIRNFLIKINLLKIKNKSERASALYLKIKQELGASPITLLSIL